MEINERSKCSPKSFFSLFNFFFPFVRVQIDLSFFLFNHFDEKINRNTLYIYQRQCHNQARENFLQFTNDQVPLLRRGANLDLTIRMNVRY